MLIVILFLLLYYISLQIVIRIQQDLRRFDAKIINKTQVSKIKDKNILIRSLVQHKKPKNAHEVISEVDQEYGIAVDESGIKLECKTITTGYDNLEFTEKMKSSEIEGVNIYKNCFKKKRFT